MRRACALSVLATLAAAAGLPGGKQAAVAAPAGAPRILYSSDWSGTFQVYASSRSSDCRCDAVARRYAQRRSGTGPVAQPVFKTGEVWQPHAGSVRLRRRSVKPKPPRVQGVSAFYGRPVGGSLSPLRTARNRWRLAPTGASLAQLLDRPIVADSIWSRATRLPASRPSGASRARTRVRQRLARVRATRQSHVA